MWCWRTLAALWLSQHSSVKQRVNPSHHTLNHMNIDPEIPHECQPARVFLWWHIESREDLCLGCQILLPLNHTAALNFVHASLATFNNMTENITYTVLQVGRLSSQVGPRMICFSSIFLPELLHLHLLICHNRKTNPRLVSDFTWRTHLFCRICHSWG